MEDLTDIFKRTFERGGNVVIPSFAVGRTQELLYIIRKIKEDNLVGRDFDVYMDSPLAIEATNIFIKNVESCFDDDANLQPLQLVLRSILVQNTPQPGMIADIQSTAEMAKVAEQLKYATIVVSSLPLLIMYPFFQKYFDKGVMVGSVKG